VSPAQDYRADCGQQLLPVVTLCIRWAVHQRKAQRRPGKRHRQLSGESASTTATALGVSRATVYRVLAEDAS